MKINNDLLLSAKTLMTDMADNSAEATNINKSDENLFEGESDSVKSAIKIIDKSGYHVTKEDVEAIRDFMNSEGSINEKLSAIKEAFSKEIPLNEKFLSALKHVETASLLDYLEDSELSLEPSTSYESENAYTREELNNIDNNLKKLFVEIENLDQTDVENKNKESLEAEIKELKYIDTISTLEKTKNRDKANYIGSEREVDNINAETKKKVKMEDDDITETLLADISMIKNYVGSAISINKNYDTYIETKITPKLLKLRNEFSDFKKDLLQTLDKTDVQGLSLRDKKEILLDAVQKIDNKIMKSEMSLFMDLKGERELLKISSELQSAVKLINKGKISEAEKIIKEQVAIVNKIKYEPSIKKAVALSTIKKPDKRDLKDIKEEIYTSANNYKTSDKSASSIVNYLRKLGINHEVESFEKYMTKNTTVKNDFVNIKNIKEMLLAMTKNPEDKVSYQKASSMINHIDKMQIKNKIADNNNLQTITLEVPLNIDGRIKNVKVFIKSPQKNLKLDWENFNMFFAFTTEKIGKIGIKVSAVNRNLSVSIINNEISKSVTTKIKEDLKSDVEEFGYKIVKMALELWKSEQKKEEPDKPIFERVFDNAEGFDYRI